MLEYGMTLNNALNFIRRSRNIINPNPGFRKQLAEFEKKLRQMRKEGRLEMA
jgi:hypothetical protein